MFLRNMISSFLEPDQAYKSAQAPLESGFNEAKGYEIPYWQQGVDQYGRLNEAENSLLNPEQLENRWASSYEMSPYAKRLIDMSKAQGLDAASSMGLLGSSGALNNIQQSASDIASRDRQQYIQDLMQQYMQGIGIGQNIYGTGATMGANLGNLSNQYGENQAALTYGEKAAPGQLVNNLIKTGVQAAGNNFNPSSGGYL